MLQGTFVAMAIVSLLLFAIFRSIRLGLVSLIPNFLPAAMAMGLWGYLVGEVGVPAAVVTAIAFGIIVDDTIHFMTKYTDSRKAGNLPSALFDCLFLRVRLQTEATPDRATSSLLSGSAGDSLHTPQRARNPGDRPGASRSGAACPSASLLHPEADQPDRADTRSKWQNTSPAFRRCAVWVQRLGRVPRKRRSAGGQ